MRYLLGMRTLLWRAVLVWCASLLTVTLGWGQSDVVTVLPTAVGLEGDAAGQLLDPDPRHAPPALLALYRASDAAGLQALLVEGPSPFAATRALTLSLLGEESADFLRAYAFEGGAPDPALSGPELTALLNALPLEDARSLAVWDDLLNEPELVGAGAALEARAFQFIALGNALRASGLRAREQRELIEPLRQAVFLTPERKAAFLPDWLARNTGTTDRLEGGPSQLLTLVALDDGVEGQLKRGLIQSELGVPVGEGFSSAQLGAIYETLKVIPVALRNGLNRIDTLDVLSPSTPPTSDIAGLYTFRRIGLKVSLSPDGLVGTLQHELGHLAWDTMLTVQQRTRYGELYASSRKGTLDFVSNYAQTNAGEDYAEVFETYLQDTADWLARSAENDTLRQKLMLGAAPLLPFAYQTTSGLAGPQIRRATVAFRHGLPDLSPPLQWQLP